MQIIITKTGSEEMGAKSKYWGMYICHKGSQGSYRTVEPRNK
jgi:hypothetical protein